MDTTTHEQFTVPLSRLMLDPTNVRKKHDKDSIASMKASILAEGVIQPLAVRPPLAGDADLGGQLYRVFAGGRRLRAMEELAGDRSIPADYPVPIIVRDVGDRLATEMSLTENVIRRQMEPADEFRAFKELADGGMSVAEIALRFGQTERFVNGRLALGNLHPTILAAFEAEEISFNAVTAYTLSPDQNRQIEYWNTRQVYHRDNQHMIRQSMRAEAIKSTSPVAILIGEEAYRSAGGAVLENLFGDEVYWTSDEIITRIKEERITQYRADAIADGWSFFETIDALGVNYWDLKKIAPTSVELTEAETERMDEISGLLEQVDENNLDDEQKKEFAALSDEYDALEAKTSRWTAEQMAATGVVLDIERKLLMHGVVRPGEKVPGSTGGSLSASKDEKPERDPLAITQPVLDMMAHAATAALAKGVREKPQLALALLAAQLTMIDNSTYGVPTPTRISVERGPGQHSSSEKPKSFDATFKAFAAMSIEDLIVSVATTVAGKIDLSEWWFQTRGVDNASRDKMRKLCLDAFEVDPLPEFDAQAFFDGSRKPVIEDAMLAMTGHHCTSVKKGDMAKEAAEHARKTGWLPAMLRTKAYAPVKPDKPAKAKGKGAKKS